MVSFRVLAISAMLGVIVAVAGCGSSDQVSIQGQVTFDGQAVGPGSIVFLPDGEGAKIAAAIEDGKYRIGPERGAKAGNFRVQINWSKKTGRQIASADPGMMMDETVEAIPPQYNRDTTLRQEVKVGDNTIDFDLRSN